MPLNLTCVLTIPKSPFPDSDRSRRIQTDLLDLTCPRPSSRSLHSTCPLHCLHLSQWHQPSRCSDTKQGIRPHSAQALRPASPPAASLKGAILAHVPKCPLHPHSMPRTVLSFQDDSRYLQVPWMTGVLPLVLPDIPSVSHTEAGMIFKISHQMMSFLC